MKIDSFYLCRTRGKHGETVGMRTYRVAGQGYAKVLTVRGHDVYNESGDVIAKLNAYGEIVGDASESARDLVDAMSAFDFAQQLGIGGLH